MLAINRKGTVKTLARGLGNGLNPIMAIAPAPAKRAAGTPAAGVFIADTVSKKVFFAPAAALKKFVGGVLVASELTGQFWLVRPKATGSGFEALPVTTDLPAIAYNLEGSTFVP